MQHLLNWMRRQARFDERGIADPLIGSVHDPIYQGAGAMGQAGIPQPKKVR